MHAQRPKSGKKWIGEASHQPDEFGLTCRAGLPEQAVEVGLDGRLRDAKSIGRVRDATHLDQREQDTQFTRRRQRRNWPQLGAAPPLRVEAHALRNAHRSAP
jgi:hypothetical protein